MVKPQWLRGLLPDKSWVKGFSTELSYAPTVATRLCLKEEEADTQA